MAQITERKKCRPRKWAERQFTADSIPSLNTIKSWINKQIIDGVIIGGEYWVFEDTEIRTHKLNKSAISPAVPTNIIEFISA